MATQLEHSAGVKRVLVEQAIGLELEPESLRVLAKRVVGHLDPDGPEPKAEEQHRRRRVLISQNYDGTSVVHGVLSAECTAIWHAVLASLAASRATATTGATGNDSGNGEVDGDPLGPDTCNDWQRLHDAFEHAGRMLLSSERLPRHAGLAAELLITIDLRDLRPEQDRTVRPGAGATMRHRAGATMRHRAGATMRHRAGATMRHRAGATSTHRVE